MSLPLFSSSYLLVVSMYTRSLQDQWESVNPRLLRVFDAYNETPCYQQSRPLCCDKPQ